MSHPRLVVKAGSDSHVTFAQSYLSQGGVCLANGFTRILVGDRANVVRIVMRAGDKGTECGTSYYSKNMYFCTF